MTKVIQFLSIFLLLISFSTEKCLKQAGICSSSIVAGVGDLSYELASDEFYQDLESHSLNYASCHHTDCSDNKNHCDHHCFGSQCFDVLRSTRASLAMPSQINNDVLWPSRFFYKDPSLSSRVRPPLFFSFS